MVMCVCQKGDNYLFDYVIPYSILLSGESTSTKSSCRSKVPTKILEENDSSLSEIDEDATNNGGHFQVS